jgi:hypothetical protein
MEKNQLEDYEIDMHATNLMRQMLVEYKNLLQPSMQVLATPFFEQHVNLVVVLRNKSKADTES